MRGQSDKPMRVLEQDLFIQVPFFEESRKAQSSGALPQFAHCG
jgi:hypothetical protein